MYYTRFLEDKITDKKSSKKVKLLLGPRQSGKSTLLKHCLVSKSDIMTINLQDRRERIKYERDQDAFLQELEVAVDVHTVVIDEIQKVPELLDDVQYFFDKDNERFNFFLTGSSARRLKSHSANLQTEKNGRKYHRDSLESILRQCRIQGPEVYIPVAACRASVSRRSPSS